MRKPAMAVGGALVAAACVAVAALLHPGAGVAAFVGMLASAWGGYVWAKWKRPQFEPVVIKPKVALDREGDLQGLGMLAGGIAHDFNNLLTGILGNTSLALGELPPGLVRDAVREADTAARRARELVAQILAYSGRGRLEARAVDLSTLVRETAGLLGRVVGPNTRLRIDAAPASIVEADPAQVRQIVMNLITNAADALGSAPGDVTVTVAGDALDRAALDATLLGGDLPPGRYVRIEVADTGCGMDAATLARMFEPYFTTKFGGRGLGLAALQGIVRHHRGTVRVDSTPGAGTVVRVWLPEAEGISRVDPSDVAATPHPAERTGTVLLVEDEELVRRVATRMLSKLGYNVLVARDGDDGLRILAEDRGELTLALVDVMMPGMDGRQVLRLIRERRPDLPVVLMTGYAGEEREAAPDAWLRKPFAVRDLLEALDAALRASDLSITGRPAPERATR